MISTGIREYLRPASLEEAWAAIAQCGSAASPVGGGIDVRLYATPNTTTLVDLAGLGLGYVRDAHGLAIGATTTFTEILESTPAKGYLDGILVDVLERVASPLQRNVGTVGGTLGSAHPWSDVIPLLLVLDAALLLYDGRERVLPLEEYLAARASAERPLIVEVRLPMPPPSSMGAFEAFTRTGFDVSILNCACLVSAEAGRCRAARIAVGGTPALATRLPAVERALTDAPLDDPTIDRIAALAGETIDARDDRRASAEYRRDLARVGLSRCLRRISEAGGNG